MVTQLPTFRGYTVDLRLKEFRRIDVRIELSEFVRFDTPKGRELYALWLEHVEE